jgi:hypothetical protein
MSAETFMNLWKRTAIEMIDTSSCMACDKPSEVHMLATRADGEMVELLVCKEHALDPGPLLDW